MVVSKQLVAILLCGSMLAYADGNIFTKVRYNGGSAASKVDPKDWGNKLVVTPETVRLELKGKPKTILEIPSRSITSLSYGQEAHRRVGTMIALAILVAPVALFGLLHKTRLHYIGIQYKLADDKTGGILLQGDKDNYRAMLVALQGVSGVPVSVAEKEREFVPVGVTTSITKGSEEPNGTAPAAPPPASPAEVTGTVSVDTIPVGADVYVDGQFYGNSPATVKLKPGKHAITVKMNGFKDWAREISCDAGSTAHLSATLEKPTQF